MKETVSRGLTASDKEEEQEVHACTSSSRGTGEQPLPHWNTNPIINGQQRFSGSIRSLALCMLCSGFCGFLASCIIGLTSGRLEDL